MTNRLLQMSSMELRQCLAQEVAENPALESVEEQTCGNCDLPGLQCPECPFAYRRGASERDRLSLSAPPLDEDPDPFARVAALPTLQEHLEAEFRAVAAPPLVAAGQYLIASIDDDGYLRCSVQEVCAALDLPPDTVEEALRLIQSFEPAGVGARSLQECLLLQVRTGTGDRKAHPLAEALLTHCWKELVAGKLPQIARRLRAGPSEVHECVRWIRAELSPYPGQSFRPSWRRDSHRSAPPVRPDVIVHLDDDGALRLEIPREETTAISLNPEYARLFQRMRDAPQQFSEAERKHVREYLHRAQLFLKGLNDRVSILRQVAECLLDEQEDYFRLEQEEAMRPVTRAQFAGFLRVHESTISRAVAEKYLQLPSGRVVPLSHFFDRALSHRKLVANVVASENPTSPYSDQEISDILRRQGIVIARRTVLKYREEMNILSSRQRARLSA